MKKRILFLHGINYTNAGDLGISCATINQFKKVIPEADIVVLSPYSTEFKSRKIDVKKWGIIEIKDILQTPQDTLRKKIMAILTILRVVCYIKFFKKIRIGKILLKSHELKVIREYEKANIVVSKGGGFLLDTGKGLPISSHFFPIYFATLFKKPTVIYAQSIGPFKRKIAQFAVEYILKNVDLILLREELSEKYIKEMHLKKPIIKITSDDGFLLDVADNKTIKIILKKEGINRKKNQLLVGISVCYWNFPFANFSEKTGFNKYINSIVGLIDYLIKKYNARIVLVPHVFDRLVEGSKFDDYKLSQYIKAKINKKESVHILSAYSAEETKGIIGNMDIFIGTRMHSNIYALGMHVPTLVISYLPKSAGIMKMMDLDEWIIPISTINLEILINKVERLLKNRYVLKNKLKKTVRLMQDKAKNNAKILKKFLKELK